MVSLTYNARKYKQRAVYKQNMADITWAPNQSRAQRAPRGVSSNAKLIKHAILLS